MEVKFVTRADAKRQGLKQYFTGSMCPKHHVAPRWTCSGNCTICTQESFESRKETVYERQRRNYVRTDKRIQQQRATNLRRYGLTIEQYDQMLFEQSYVCAICHKPCSKALAVDHDHKTGAVRGLLCMNCNHGLGKFKDDPNLLMAAIKYLQDQNKT